MGSCRRVVLVVCAMVLAAVAAGCGASAAGPSLADRRARQEALRHSAAAEVYEACKDSVVGIAVRRRDETKPNVTHSEQASGVILDDTGYVITNAHALRYGGRPFIRFSDGREFPAHVVAVDESRDLAVLKMHPTQPLKPVMLGRSRDLMVGEPVVAMGSPFGMGMTVAQGIVSAMGRATKSEFTFYPDMIQTDASINPGSSGGALLNVHGELVGINTTKKREADNISFVIPVDRVRAALPDVLDPEGRGGFSLGIQVGMDGPAEVTAVAKGSPAEAAGVWPGDLVFGVGKTPVVRGLDFYLALLDVKGGQPLLLRLVRKGQTIEVTAMLAKVEPRAADSPAGAAPGLVCEFYEGRWDRLPDFATLQPKATTRVEMFSLGQYKDRDHFALRLTGYVDVPADGHYAFFAAADDGCRLFIGDRLVVDNDGPHYLMEKRGYIPLKAGKHAITVLYFDRTETDELKVSWEGPGIKKQPIPATALSAPAGK